MWLWKAFWYYWERQAGSQPHQSAPHPSLYQLAQEDVINLRGRVLKKKERKKKAQKAWHAHTRFLCLLLSDDACHLMCESHVCFSGINCNKTAPPSLSYEFMNLLRETQSFKIPLAYSSETMFSFNLPAASARREPQQTEHKQQIKCENQASHCLISIKW